MWEILNTTAEHLTLTTQYILQCILAVYEFLHDVVIGSVEPTPTELCSQSVCEWEVYPAY